MTVQFESIVISDDESAGILIFTLNTSRPADFTVQISTRQLDEAGVGSGAGADFDEFATG